MRQLRGKRDHVIVLLRGTAHGLAEAERHEVHLQLFKHTLGAALGRHKDHARTVKQFMVDHLEQAAMSTVSNMNGFPLSFVFYSVKVYNGRQVLSNKIEN